MMQAEHKLGITISATDKTAAAFDSVKGRFARASKDWAASAGLGPSMPGNAAGMAGGDSFLKELRSTFGGKSTFGLAAKTLAGGGAVAGLVYAAHATEQFAEQVSDLATKFRAGELTAKEFAGQAARAIPVVGDLAKAFDAIWQAGADVAGWQTEGGLQALLKRREGFDAAVKSAQRAHDELADPFKAMRDAAQDWYKGEVKKIREAAKATDTGPRMVEHEIEELGKTLAEKLRRINAEQLKSGFAGVGAMDYSGETGVPKFTGAFTADELRGAKLDELRRRQAAMLGPLEGREHDLTREMAAGLKRAREGYAVDMARELLRAKGDEAGARALDIDAGYRQALNNAGGDEERELIRRRWRMERENLRFGEAMRARGDQTGSATIAAPAITSSYRGLAEIQSIADRSKEQKDLARLAKEHLAELRRIEGSIDGLTRALTSGGLGWEVD